MLREEAPAGSGDEEMDAEIVSDTPETELMDDDSDDSETSLQKHHAFSFLRRRG